MSTILVADDDPVIQRLVSFILEQDGHEVVLAEDGQEALDRIAERAFDLVLLDLDMPCRSGLEVLSQLRSQPEHDELPIVILTASAQDRDAEAAWAAGVSQFLTKPFSSRSLRSTVDRLIA